MSEFRTEEDSHVADTMRDEEEQEHWSDVARAMLMYEDFMLMHLENRQRRLSNLSDEQFRHLPKISTAKFDKMKEAVDVNTQFFEEIVLFQDFQFSERIPRVLPDKYSGRPISADQMHRNEAVLHSLVREWSVEGQEERHQAFEPILAELSRLLPVTAENAYQQRVLVPGCGVGRLPLEVAGRGYISQANEFSVYMLMAAHFMLNAGSEANRFTIYPWLDRLSNIERLGDIFSSISIPDRSAVDILSQCEFPAPEFSGPPDDDPGYVDPETGLRWLPRFSMAAGDFCELYGADNMVGQWDCIITCFFIDTAPVVVDYISVIHRALRPGGKWINLGPLLYHWASTADADAPGDARYTQSVELSWEELEHVIKSVGFRFEREHDSVSSASQETTPLTCSYASSKRFMMWNVYRPLFFSCSK